MKTEEFLAHYGVKGMKWGQRKSARQSRIKDGSASSTDRLVDAYSRSSTTSKLGATAVSAVLASIGGLSYLAAKKM